MLPDVVAWTRTKKKPDYITKDTDRHKDSKEDVDTILIPSTFQLKKLYENLYKQLKANVSKSWVIQTEWSWQL